MLDRLDSTTEDFFLTWGANIAVVGGACLLLGMVAGWIIWRKTRTLTEKIESGNREALADFETSSDDVSKIRAELSGSRSRDSRTETSS